MAITSLQSIFGGCRLLVVGYWLDCPILPTTNYRQPITNNQTPSESEKRQFVITKLLGCKSYAFTR